MPYYPEAQKHRLIEYFTTAVLLSVNIDVEVWGDTGKEHFFEVLTCNFKEFGIFILR